MTDKTRRNGGPRVARMDYVHERGQRTQPVRVLEPQSTLSDNLGPLIGARRARPCPDRTRTTWVRGGPLRAEDAHFGVKGSPKMVCWGPKTVVRGDGEVSVSVSLGILVLVAAVAACLLDTRKPTPLRQ